MNKEQGRAERRVVQSTVAKGKRHPNGCRFPLCYLDRIDANLKKSMKSRGFMI